LKFNSIGKLNSIEIQNGLLKSIEIEFNSNWLIRKAVNYLKTGQTSFIKQLSQLSDHIEQWFFLQISSELELEGL
jgi:hypothetical protein